MGYQTVLFCQDEKLARVLSQVFAEVDFTVDHAADAFSVVKKLMAQRYDAVVVDCDNEQNSALVFKSARNSALNQNSLAIAVVEGQSGVARAYRMGASLVLTKPISVEHVKGTLRVARGLLRKNAEAATNGQAAGSAPVVNQPAASSKAPALPAAPATPKASPAPIAAVSALTAPSSFPAAAAPALSRQAAEPALQELPAAPMSKSRSSRTALAPAESAATTAASVSIATEGEEELDALNDVSASTPASSPVARPRPSSSAPPAKPSVAPKQSEDEDDEEMEFVFDSPAGEPPLMSIYETAEDAAKQAPNRKKIFIVVMTIFIALIAAYYTWSKYGPGSSVHPQPGSSAPQQKGPLSYVEPQIPASSQLS